MDKPSAYSSTSVTIAVNDATLGSLRKLPTNSGVLNNFALQFIAEPARQYLLGVVNQVQIIHNLTDDYGRPLPTPPQGAMTCFGILNSTVDSMYVSRQILVA